MIRVYRLVQQRGPEADEPFQGSATANHWNDEGTTVAYASESIAVCALEILSQWREYRSLSGYRIYGLDLRPQQVEDVRERPEEVDVDDHERTRTFGDDWVRQQRSLALRVPTVVVPFGCNYLVNPQHPAFDAAAVLDLGPFGFDDRIVDMIDAAKEREERERDREQRRSA